MRRAFIIRPFGQKLDGAGRVIDFDKIQADLIDPALTEAGAFGGTTGEIIEAGNIREDMFGLILEADIVVCDMTIHNANVFYELGIRHAVRRNRSVLIRGEPTADTVPFDNLTDRFLAYDLDDPRAALQRLTETLRATLSSERTDSPFFKFFPSLHEVDTASVQIPPEDLAEEVERAKAANLAGWLRLLSQDVEDRRFQWPALRMIGKAQWDIGDHEGADRTYQKLVASDAVDIDAAIALANLYEEQYRREKRAELLAKSDQAIKRVLGDSRATQEQRTEALSLAGRNAKTLWQQAFQGLTNLAEARKVASNRRLIDAYYGYWTAYSSDLNHYRSGVAALQMCAIGKCLAEEEAWGDAFGSDKEARDKKEELEVAFDRLKIAVKLSVEQTQQKLPAGSNARIWADISNADLLFLTEEKQTRVKQAYKDAVPASSSFVDAVRSQLELFAKLGVNAVLAEAVIAELDSRNGARQTVSPASSIVIVAGHRIDEPGRGNPRFPESAEPAVKGRLKEELERLNQEPGGMRVLASAAPGTDIICHELCRELGIKSTICLPMPADKYSTEIFKDLDGWRRRFLALTGAGADCLRLSDAPGLPRWLQATGTNEWERGNRCVLQLARSARTPKVALIAVWDENAVGDAKGGTAHMVQIARAAGNIDVRLIKLKDGAILATNR